MKEKILVGLSGGVDSAVAAFLLKSQGYDVTCAFMRNWDSFSNQDILGNPNIHDDICPQEQDYFDAKMVADQLELPLLRIDFVKEYWEDVFQRFLNEYEKGNTPNPDILCNKYIKFDAFMNFATQKGFNKVATGHYVQVEHKQNKSLLLRGADKNKDQSYFLCQVPSKGLQRSIFPIGHLEKNVVREIAAREHLLSVAEKKDSTGICFIGERNFKAFLHNYLKDVQGLVVDIETLKTLGEHEGVMYYTIGQRKGLRLGGSTQPYFVVGKDMKNHILYVANKMNAHWLISDSCIVSHINWFADLDKHNSYKCSAKFRYRQLDHDVELQFIDDTSAICMFPQGVEGVTSGQEAVFYDHEYCLGGGHIEEVFQNGDILNDKIQERGIYAIDN